MGIRFSESTIKAGFLVTQPDWYKVTIAPKVNKKRTKADDSNNYFVTFEVVGIRKGAGEEAEKMIGVPVTMMYNDKEESAWTSVKLFTAANGGDPLTPDQDYEFEALGGITLEAYIKRGSRQDGSPQNVAEDFAPLGTNIRE